MHLRLDTISPSHPRFNMSRNVVIVRYPALGYSGKRSFSTLINNAISSCAEHKKILPSEGLRSWGDGQECPLDLLGTDGHIRYHHLRKRSGHPEPRHLDRNRVQSIQRPLICRIPSVDGQSDRSELVRRKKYLELACR